MSNDKILSTSNGAPIPDDQTSITVGPQGPLTVENWRLLEKLAHFNRERIPERIVHARGTGAFGTFTLSKDLSDYTIAKFLQGKGKQTDVFIRFSTVGGGQDSSDYARDPRGFAVKFYTEEGNWDMVGNNTPVFFLRDPIKFPDFIHSQKKNPRTNCPDPAAMYEFWANSPQSLHQVTILMSDRGIPYSYRHMNGYSSHALSFWNQHGQRFWVKWHFKTKQGIRTLTNDEAAALPTYGTQLDLVEAIDRGEYPQWAVKLQIATSEQLAAFPFNPFDLTKVWPHGDFPLMDIGILELNKNVTNYFAQVEQATFAPSNFVPGIGASPDKMLQARLFAYTDAHHYRVGVNDGRLSVNAPRCPAHNYQRDGKMADIHVHHSDQECDVNFYPNDRAKEGAPQPFPAAKEPPFVLPNNAIMDYYNTENEDNFTQAGNLFRLMSDSQKDQLASNIAAGLQFANKSIQQRMLVQFEQADVDYRRRVEEKLEE